MTRFWRIETYQGSGGFLCPPGHHNHTHSAWEYPNTRSKREISITGIEYLLTSEADASENIQRRVREIIAEHPMKCSELWVQTVYGYFRSMYVPESGSRNAATLVQDPSRGPENHAAVACIREYFPDHQPRLSLIENPGRGYGSWPCDKCGERVQYEAKFDAWTVVMTRSVPREGTVWNYATLCSKDSGAHEVALYPANEE